MHLHERLTTEVDAWRQAGYPVDGPWAVAELLEWAHGSERGNVRHLRAPQLRALEVYWHLRLVRNTPKVVDLYRTLFARQTEFLTAIGLGDQRIRDVVLDLGLESVLERVRTDDGFVRDFRLEAVRETLTLDYPSYILALAMGAGKTVLIGAIIATEFALALDSPDGPFVHNALVFAPGKTIIESLRELLSMPYESVLPPRLHRAFMASVKMTFTRDGEKDLPVIRGSHFNVVVTNTEKIRIQKETIRKGDLGSLLAGSADEARAEVANLRLQAIASLPNLAVFSDEAHHTYGQSLDTDLKKVRRTVDYLAGATTVKCVVNTTGTPYYQRQPLRDVVAWYGLSEGIRDGILKDVGGNIQALQLDGDAKRFVRHVVTDFFKDYRDVRLPDGSPAKLAIYFPQTDDLQELRPVVDDALAQAGISPTLCLVNTSDVSLTRKADIDAFNRLNDPAAPHRVLLLVNKGTEGWNCPSLFGCALARQLRSSNNFVLQAATRCLRQVPGNSHRARIYLTQENYGVLDRQLQETYGERITDLDHAGQERRRARLVVRKPDAPPILIRKQARTVVRRALAPAAPGLVKPSVDARDGVMRRMALGAAGPGGRVLQQIGESVTVTAEPETMDAYAAAVELAAGQRLDPLSVLEAVRAAYGSEDVPAAHLPDLAAQIDSQVAHYEIHEYPIEVALALVRPEGFTKEQDPEGQTVYVAQIAYPVGNERLLLHRDDIQKNPRDLGFHYTPLEFDSMPERSFFEQVLARLNIEPWDVEDVYFTGGITDPGKTDFFVEYKDVKGKWRRYTPDFVIRRKPGPGMPAGSGRVCIVEVKAENERVDQVNGLAGAKAMALKKLERLNVDRLKYEMIFTATSTVEYDSMQAVWTFCERPDEDTIGVPIDQSRIREFCERWRVAELALFGSVLRPDFSERSDVDVLVSFAPGARWSLLDHERMEEELETVWGRRIDLVTRRSVERSHNWIRRRNILESARPIYVA
ncbi:MAG: nucleotidyltransferase domain-containing protein [Vicinamibacterales bacterium]